MSDDGKPAPGESPFWRFSLRFYALDGVAPACLALQDEADVDVNLLLFLLFLAEEGRAVEAADVRGFDERVAAWRDLVVKPLRTLRRQLKPGIPPVPHGVGERFRDQVKRAELEAERIEQRTLEEAPRPAVAAGFSRDDVARRNIAAYSGTGKTLPQAPVAAILAAFRSLKVQLIAR
jgi:uncharacterized protein (TIGR02444 family)